MFRQFVVWCIRKMSRANQKAVLIELLDEIVESRDATIDKQLGELIIAKVVKSTGNDITAFIVRGR